MIGIGSGGNFRLAAARALLDIDGRMDAEAIVVRKAMKIAGDICIYTTTTSRSKSLNQMDDAAKATAARGRKSGREALVTSALTPREIVSGARPFHRRPGRRRSAPSPSRCATAGAGSSSPRDARRGAPRRTS